MSRAILQFLALCENISKFASSQCNVFIVLGTGTYVPVITGRQEVGVYRGSPVFRVTALQFLCCNQRLGDLTPEEVCTQTFVLEFIMFLLLFEVSRLF